MPRTEIRVETIDYGPATLLERRGLREQMISILMKLDVWIDPSPTIDEDFWGLIRSEIGRRGLSCDDLPGGPRPSSDKVGTLVILSESKLSTVLEAVRDAIEHWMMRGHSRARAIDIAFMVAKGKGIEKAEVRGPVEAILDALVIGRDGFSEVGR